MWLFGIISSTCEVFGTSEAAHRQQRESDAITARSEARHVASRAPAAVWIGTNAHLVVDLLLRVAHRDCPLRRLRDGDLLLDHPHRRVLHEETNPAAARKLQRTKPGGECHGGRSPSGLQRRVAKLRGRAAQPRAIFSSFSCSFCISYTLAMRAPSRIMSSIWRVRSFSLSLISRFS